MDTRIPSSLKDWQFLNAEIEDHFKISTTPRLEAITWFVIISGPITGLIYLISAWKRCKTDGSWLVRIDEEGYLYPQNFVMIPIVAFAYTCVNLFHSTSLLMDLKSYVNTRTFVSSLLTFPVLTSFGWTRIWSLHYAVPPSKHRMAYVDQKIGSPSQWIMARYHSATLFNLFVIAGYLLCLFGTAPSIASAIKNVLEIKSSFARYQTVYPRVIEVLTDQKPAISTELQALLVLKKMADSQDQLRQNLRTIFAILLVIAAIQTVALLWLSFRILAALYYQVMILRQAGKRLNHIRLHLDRNGFLRSRATVSYGNLKIASAPNAALESRSIFATLDTLNLKCRMRHYLPTLRRGTGVSAALWKSGPFSKTQEQLVDGGMKQMVVYYRQLRRYAMNTFWQTAITAAVMISFLVLLSMLVGPAYKSALVVELEVIVFVWVNITWNCGTGLLLSILSCVVAFSPAPMVPSEPTRPVDNSKEYFCS